MEKVSQFSSPAAARSLRGKNESSSQCGNCIFWYFLHHRSGEISGQGANYPKAKVWVLSIELKSQTFLASVSLPQCPSKVANPNFREEHPEHRETRRSARIVSGFGCSSK